jgi:ketosteroid isomerase-like protein
VGRYVSIWRFHEGSGWALVFDAGISHAPPVPAVDEPVSRGSDRGRAGGTELSDLQAADQVFSEAASRTGFAEAMGAHAAPDVRVYMTGAQPAVGVEAVRALVEGFVPGRWVASGGGVAASGDLGYTYGLAVNPMGETGETAGQSVYLRIWEKPSGGDWRVVLDLWNPLPLLERREP